jgi:hypothetical protein
VILDGQPLIVRQLAEAQRKLGIATGGVRAIQASGTSVLSTGTVQFANSNGITFGLNGSVITASVAAGAAVGAISAGTELATSGTVRFANSNGITFGMSNSSIITASHNGLTSQSIQTQGSLLLNGSSGAITISGSELASVSNNASTIIVSARSESLHEIQNPTQTKLFNMGTQNLGFQWNGVGTHPSFDGAFELEAIGAFSGDLIHLHQHVGAPGAADIIHVEAEATNVTALRLSPAASVACEISMSNTGMPFKVLNTQGTVMCESLNVEWVDGFKAVNLVASNKTYSNATVTLAGAGLVQVQSNAANSIIISADPQTAIVGIQAGTGTATSGTVILSNSNGVSFGLNGQTVTASVNALTFSAGTSSGALGSIVLSNSNNVSFGLNGSTITASAGGVGGGGIAGIAGSGASTVTSGTVVFANSNGISFGLNGSTMTAVATQGVASLNGSYGQISLSAGNLIYMPAIMSGITIHNLLSSSNTIIDVQTIGSAGTLASRFALADHQHAGVANASVSGNTVGTTSGGPLSNLVLAGGPNITLSGATGAGGVLSLSISGPSPGAGGAQSISSWPPEPHVGFYLTAPIYTGASGSTGGSTQFTASGLVYSLAIPYQVEFSNLDMFIALNATSSGTGSATVGLNLGIYTLNANTALSLMSSFHWGMLVSQNSITARTHQWWWGPNSTANSTGASGNSSASFSGTRRIFLRNANLTLAPGNYYVGVMMTQRSSSVNVYGIASWAEWTGALTAQTSFMGSNVASTRGYGGLFSTTTNTNVIVGGLFMPGSIHTSRITNTGGISQWRRPAFLMVRSLT